MLQVGYKSISPCPVLARLAHHDTLGNYNYFPSPWTGKFKGQENKDGEEYLKAVLLLRASTEPMKVIYR
jgi:hypothetical protein